MSGDSSAAGQAQQTYSEREARYQAARQRIFADASTGSDGTVEKKDKGVVRQPKGPAEGVQGQSKGFVERRGGGSVRST